MAIDESEHREASVLCEFHIYGANSEALLAKFVLEGFQGCATKAAA